MSNRTWNQKYSLEETSQESENTNELLQMLPLFAFLILLFFVFLGTKGYGDSSSLPKGVRAFVFQRHEGRVTGQFDSSGTRNLLAVEENLGVDLIKSAASEAEVLIDQIREADPNLADQIDLGQISIDPDVNVDVNVFALGWGITDQLMVIGVLPVYKAKVSLEGGFSESLSFERTAERIRFLAETSGSEQRAELLGLAQILENLPRIRGEHLQGVLVNQYNYKPLGDWTGSGIGDIQLLMHYRLLSGPIAGSAVRAGFEFPTGRKDDPDNLLDIPFGSGNLRANIESLNDFRIWKKNIIFSVNGKYTHNFKSNREMRLVTDLNGLLPISGVKEILEFNRGDSLSLQFQSKFKLIPDLYATSGYMISSKNRDQFNGFTQNYNYSLLEQGTDSVSHTTEVSLSYSTVSLFQQKKFPLPFKVDVGYNWVVEGTNTEATQIGFLKFEGYF